MYLKQVAIENSGPLRSINFDLAFTASDHPKPLVLVGSNGGGKTNLLSLVTDALFEAAAVHYDNVLPARGIGRSWFRVVGRRTTTLGTSGGFSLLRFEHEGQSLVYQEKGGSVDPIAARLRVPDELASEISWPMEGPFKKFGIDDEQSRLIFETEVYGYFPSSRSEIPFWLNRDSIPETEFETFPAFLKKLRKPLFVEKSLHQFKQWVIALILDSRADIARISENPSQFQLLGDAGHTFDSMSSLALCNTVLRRVLDDNGVRFVWLGRNSDDKVAVARNNELLVPNIDALSGGQSILLGLFGTLLRYADQSQPAAALDNSAIGGICVVDEIDAHLHVDLQYKILPGLMALFPRIQFIVSSHSPLFVLGMKQTFGDDGFQILDMPGGKVVTSETYAEFGRAMEALFATDLFNNKLLAITSNPGVPIVFVEGETDAPYLCRAAKVLGRSELLQRCEIHWVGAKDDKGQGFHTGKGALDHTLSVLRANPKLTSRAVLLLYDNDAKKSDADYGEVCVRSMPTNESNTKVKAGVENLLAEAVLTDTDYETSESSKPNGDLITRKTLRKAELCKRICADGTEADFCAFTPTLDIIEQYIALKTT